MLWSLSAAFGPPHLKKKNLAFRLHFGPALSFLSFGLRSVFQAEMVPKSDHSANRAAAFGLSAPPRARPLFVGVQGEARASPCSDISGSESFAFWSWDVVHGHGLKRIGTKASLLFLKRNLKDFSSPKMSVGLFGRSTGLRREL